MESKVTRRRFLRASALAATAAALAACGATPTATPVPPTATKPPAAPTAAPAAPTAAPAAPTATKAPAPTNTSVPPTPIPPTPTVAKPTIVEVTVARSENPLVPIRENAPAHAFITEQTGVKFVWQVVGDTEWLTKSSVMLASKQVPDMFYANQNTIRDFSDPAILKPLLPLIEKSGPNIKKYMAGWPGMKKLLSNNDLYHLPSVSFNEPKSSCMPQIRKDMLDKVGLPLPTDFDQLFNALVEMKKAFPSTIGWSNRVSSKSLLRRVAFPLGSGMGTPFRDYGPYWDKDVGGGKWLFGPINPEFRDVLAYLNKCYKAGVLDPDIVNATYDQWMEKMSSGKSNFTYDNMAFTITFNKALQQKEPTAKVVVMRTPKGPKGFRYQAFGGFFNGWAIGANSKNAERIIQLLNWVITPLGIDTVSWGVEGQQYTVKKPRPAALTDYSHDALEKAMPKDRNALMAAVIEKYKTAKDAPRAFQSDIGLGQEIFAPIYDPTPSQTWNPPGDAKEIQDVVDNDPALEPPFDVPPFTKEETELLKKYQTAAETLLDPAYDKVILGMMSLSDYDKVVAQAKAAGAGEIERIFNEAEARVAKG